MAVEIGVVLSVISCVIAVTSFALNNKKTNKTDGFELGNFMGEIRTEIASIKDLINELKQDNKEVDEKISKNIKDHEARFHSHN